MFNWKRAARIAWAVTAASLLLACAGCAGAAAWLSDATQIVPLAASMIASILTLVAALQGKSVSASDLTAVSTFATDIENGLDDLETMIDQYKATPTANLEQEILNAANVVVSNIQNFLTNTQLANAALAQKVTAIATLVQTELKAWIEVIPALSATAGEKVTFTVPYSAKALRQAFDAILAQPTGDPDVDAAATKVKKL